MKTKFRISALLGILVLIILGITSCEKVPIVEDPVAKYYTVTVLGDPNGVVLPKGVTISKGDPSQAFTFKMKENSSQLFTIKPNPGFLGSVLVDGVNLPLVTDTTFNLTNIKKDCDVKPVFAKDPKFPWLLVDERGWLEVELWGLNSGVWYPYYVNGWTLYFLPNGEKKITDGHSTGDSNWDLDQSTTPPTLHTGRCATVPEGEVTKIERLDETTLILSNPTTRIIYKHP